MKGNNYRVFAALHEETDKGWAWLPEDYGFASRMTIKISHAGRLVYCEYRKIDENFVKRYNNNENMRCMYFETKDKAQDGRVYDLVPLRGVVVISQWCRKALGSLGTTGELVVGPKLTISKPRWHNSQM